MKVSPAAPPARLSRAALDRAAIERAIVDNPAHFGGRMSRWAFAASLDAVTGYLLARHVGPAQLAALDARTARTAPPPGVA